MPWGIAAISAAGAIGSGILGSNAAGDAAKAQSNAANLASKTELDMFNQTVAREQPFVDAGTNALSGLQKLLGLGPGGVGTPSSPILAMLGLGGPGASGTIDPRTFQGSPGYQYQLQEGTNAVTNAASRTGGLGGNALRALQQTGQGLANQNWSQYLGQGSNAFQNLVGNVSNLSGMGLNAASNLGDIGTKVAAQVGGNQIGAGNAIAAGDIGSSKALQGMIQNLVSSLTTGYSGGGFGGGGGSGGSNFINLNGMY